MTARAPRHLFAWLGFITALICGAPAQAMSLEAQAALVSDYRWRGLSLSDEDPSLQLEATAAFDNGAWAWAGANTVSDALGGAEIGLGVGYDTSFATLDWSLGGIGYLYPGADDLDYVEIDASVSRAFGPLTASAGIEYAPEQDNYPSDNPYAWLALAARLGRVELHGQVGQDEGCIDPSGQTRDYSIGVSFTIDQWASDLSFVDSEVADDAWVLRIARTFAR